MGLARFPASPLRSRPDFEEGRRPTAAGPVNPNNEHHCNPKRNCAVEVDDLLSKHTGGISVIDLENETITRRAMPCSIIHFQQNCLGFIRS